MMGMSGINSFDFGKSEKKNRNSLEIVRDILVIVSARARKTRIMYQANLSYPLMEKYLGSLRDAGLLKCHDGACYLITERGKEFLQMYTEYVDRHNRVREEINGVDKDKLFLENMCFNSDFSNNRRLTNKKQVSV